MSDKEKLRDCINLIALELKKKKRQFATQLPHGSLDQIIWDAKEKFGIPVNTYISKNTIYSRMRDDRNVESFGYGPKSPMASVEGVILAIAKEKANMNQPLTSSEGL